MDGQTNLFTYNLDSKSIFYDFTTSQMLLGDVKYRGVIVLRHTLSLLCCLVSAFYCLKGAF